MEERKLATPPQLLNRTEPLAVIEPPLRGLPPPDFTLPEDWEPFESAPSEDEPSPELLARAVERARTDEQTRRWFEADRVTLVGVSLREERDQPKGERRRLRVVFLDRDGGGALEVDLNEQAERVLEVRQTREQPAPTRAEVDQAVGLARQDARLSSVLEPEWFGNAILISPADPQDPASGHRQFDVRFGPTTERLPRYRALVDLTAGMVVSAGRVRSAESSPEENRP
jgi:hypothetical protein